MKRLILLSMLLSLTSCRAQFRNVEPKEPQLVTAPFTVMYAKSDEAVLFSRNSGVTYEVDPLDLEADREYYFILQVAPCDDCEGPRKATVLFHGISPNQANRDIKKALEIHNTED